MMVVTKRPTGVNWVLLFLLCWLPLAACQQEAPLPTRVALAEIEVTAAAETGNIPPTWTPAVAETAVTPALPSDQTSQTRATSTPRNTPIIPTNTPRPTHTPTHTPTASPTVYQSFIPTRAPLTELGPSKLGLHVIHANDANIQEFVRRGQPAVIKALDNFGYLAEVKQLSPRTTIVGRFNTGSQEYVGTPEEAARDFVMSQLDQYLANPAVEYWEGWNEPDPGLSRMGWYARFEQERVRLMATYGFRSAVGGFSTGVPELDEFALFLPAIETVKQYQGILTLHEYGAPDLTYLYGDPLPGYPAYPDRGSLKFRYRWYYRELLEPNDLVVPLVISEAGVDGIIGNRPGPPGTGWYDFQDYWVQQGWGRTGPEAFINQLAWYDDGVRQDGYVIGFTVFTAGGIGHWLNYDINEILPQLTDYVVGQQ
jgi:hypothetical protein